VRPPSVLPVAVAASDLTTPSAPVSAAEAAAAAEAVGEGLGVTVPDDGPFWDSQRFYLEPVLLPGVDLGLDVAPWAVVEGVAVGVDKSYSARAQV
jgi:hypothetical protein